MAFAPSQSSSAFDQMAQQSEQIKFMERGTGAPVKALLTQSGLLPLPESSTYLLDLACGPGIVSSVLFAQLAEDEKARVKVVLGGVSPQLVDAAIARARTEGWGEGAEGKAFDAQAIPFPDATFSHVVTSFGFQFFPDSELALQTYRVLKPGGVAALTAWVDLGWVRPLQLAVPTFPTPPILTGSWADTSSIVDLLTKAGFSDVQCEETDIETFVESPEVMVRALSGFLGPVLQGENGGKFLSVLKKEYGEGEYVLKGWKALVATAKKA